MKTITKNVYNYEELSDEAKKVALNEWVANNDYLFLGDNLNERLHELLKENNITDQNDTSKVGTTPTHVFYSLSYCQGDGVMFEGSFLFTLEGVEYTAIIRHNGLHYHSYSKGITILDSNNEEVDKEGYTWGEAEAYFEKIYQKICKELEEYGYNLINYEDSEENFIETCDANDYTFTKDGIMDNQ